MIYYNSRGNFFGLIVFWFAEIPSFKNAFRFVIYRQSCYKNRVPFYFKFLFHSIHIDLVSDNKFMFSSFSKNTQYEIRRAERDGVVCEIDANKQEFVDFFNGFAQEKNLSFLTCLDLDVFKNNLLITRAVNNSLTLVMHCYLLDHESSRVRLLYSASQFRSFSASELRNLVGRANRLLHYYDMRVAKEMGIKVYDFGGYSVTDIDDEKKKINDFKKGFGGYLVEEPTFISFPCYFFFLISKIIKRLRLS